MSDTWPGNQIARRVEKLRLLLPRLEMAIIMAGQDQAIKPRRQNPVTWFLLAAHDLFGEITGEDEPGIAGPLHRFTTLYINRKPGTPVDPKIKEFILYILSRQGMQAVSDDGAYTPINEQVAQAQRRKLD